MRHPNEGTLRRLVDDPAGVADADRRHVANCPQCLAGVAEAQQDRVLIAAALEVPQSAPEQLDVERAFRRLAAATSEARAPAGDTSAATRRRWRSWLRSPVVAGVGVLAVLAGAGAAAAGDWLRIFDTERVATVALTQEDLVALPNLSEYGDAEVVDPLRVRDVGSAAEAEELSGLDAPTVADLPQGVTGEPTLQVIDQATVLFRFSAEDARRTAESEGRALPPPPPGMDGNEFRFEAGPGIAAVWSEERGVPALVVARAIAPAAYSSGVPFDTARDYLLSLPGIPDDVAAQLRGLSSDGTTLPIPIPDGLVTTSTVEVGDRDATLLETRNGAVAAVVWVEDGVVTAVAGSVSAEEALSVARGLG